MRMQWIQVLPCTVVLPRDDLLQPFGLDERDRGRELAHPEVQAGDGMVRLPVVTERTCVRA
jgi:hypothetical protein